MEKEQRMAAIKEAVANSPVAEPLTASPRVCVVMSNYNGKSWLDECLRSVLALDYPNFEVVVVDNGSVDGSTEHVRTHFPAVTVITLARNRGYAGGINAGLVYAAAQGADYFLIMNND